MSEITLGAPGAVHDGQADAMPCTCPACASPFIARAIDRETHRAVPLAGVIGVRRPEALMPVPQLIIDLDQPKCCAAWCGDACTCGRGPESADLDAIDIAGMREIEGRQ